MPLGNSITEGSHTGITRPVGERIGYRQSLYIALTGAGYNVDFVGDRMEGQSATPSFDPDHEGHPGFEASQIETNVYSYLTSNVPHAVLLHIGTNGLNSSADATSISQDLEGILDEIDRFETDNGVEITVFLAQIINRMVNHAPTTEYNGLVETIAQNRISAGDNIILVDMENDAGLDYATEMDDNLHPNDAGYAKMGQHWFSILDAFLELPQINTTVLDDAFVQQNYQFQIDAAGNPAVTYALTTFPTGMTIDSQTGLISWTPTIGQAGDHTVEVSITNLLGSDSESFTVTVNNNTLCVADLISYWKLDESSGSSYRDLFDNNATCSTCPTATTGKIAGGQQFDLTTSLSAASSSSWNWSSDDSFTIEFWLNTTSSTSGNRVIVGRDDSSTDLHYWVGLDDSGVARFVLRDRSGAGTSIGTGFGSALNDGSWHHVVAIRDDSDNTNKLYVDGTLVDQATVDYTSGFDSSVDLNIGWLNLSSGFHYEGTLDEILIYDRAISTAEISDHYADGLVGNNYCTNAPHISSTAVTDATVGQAYAYNVNAVGIPFPTYSLNTFPTGMTIDSQSGLISWVPALGQEGSNSVEVQVSNSQGQSTQSFSINVAGLPDCSAGLTHYWKLEEVANAEDYLDSFDNDDGTCTSCPTPASGRIGGAQEFGLTTNLSVPDDNSFDWAANESFSFELWINTSSSTSGNRVLLGRDDSGSDLHFWLGLDDSGTARFVLANTTNERGDIGGGVGTALNDGQWHHIAAVRDETVNKNLLYVDGALVDETTINYTADFVGTTNLNIGWLDLAPEFHFEGIIDEVVMYNRALSALDVSGHYNSGLTGTDYCPFAPAIVTPINLPLASTENEYNQRIEATGVPFPTFSLTTGPAGMTIDNTTGVLSWTPTSGQTGTHPLTVQVTNSEGSDSRSFSVEVAAVNDPPQFTAGSNQVVNEDAGPQTVNGWATNIDDGDPDLTQNLTFNIINNNGGGLFSTQPAISSTGTLTYTPAANANGTAQITITLSDDGSNTDPDNNTSGQVTFSITINALNDAPSFTKGSDQAVNEDSGLVSISNWATDLTDGDPELTQSLTFNVVNNTNSALFSSQPSVSSNGTLTYAVNPNAFGTATITLNLSDNGSSSGANDNTSADESFSITVNEINDAPTLDDIPDPTPISEGTGAKTVQLTGISAGPGENQQLQISTSSDNAALIPDPAVSYTNPNATAELTYQATPGVTGEAEITVTITDDGSGIAPNVNSISKTFTIQVTSVNNDPTFTKGEDITINEDAGVQVLSNWATNIDDGDLELNQTVTFDLFSNSNESLFASAPVLSSTGDLTYTPADNANGSAIIGLRLTDEAGASSADQSFVITINAVNDAPSFDIGPNQTVGDSDGAQTIPNWATNIDDGDPEETQTLTFEITANDNEGLFATAPSVDGTGSLSFEPAPKSSGTANISIKLTDNGATDAPNNNESAVQTFTITVNNVTGIDKKDISNSLSLYPNPISSSEINLKMENEITGEFKVVLYDISGRSHYANNLHKKGKSIELKMDVSKLPRGIYIFKIFNDKFIAEDKIFKN
ncbi:Ig-like domain-containing protein [Fulvivirgaceae bacterium BMA10]|uniref:Ig-like domain-containing protein n=1 Tax=Splendidivirga corallicola TaxID=3051826 RepID=A0ABT8KQX9_9BACT|nr:Ig-like domain-containing protein [Fulvivirgaceae bacterium BMA10]